MAARLGGRGGAEDAAVGREVTAGKPCQRLEGGSPREPDPEAVEEGAHSGRVGARRCRPRDGTDHMQASCGGKALKYARCGGDEACHVSVEQVTVLWAPVPGRREDKCAVRQESLDPRVQVSPGPGEVVKGRRR